MSTSGTFQLQIFQRHPLWDCCKENILIPKDRDQQIIHDLIYKIKANYAIDQLLPCFVGLLDKYRVDSFIVGCTEIHLLARSLFTTGWQKQYHCIDPLTIVARNLIEERP